MKNREAQASLIFRHYIMSQGANLISATYEMKDSAGKDSIPFSCLEDHQADFAEAVKWGKKGVLVRVESGTVGTSDYIFLKNTPAYIVIKYPSCFCIIDIESFLEEKKRSKRKSLTLEKAVAIAYKVVSLGKK